MTPLEKLGLEVAAYQILGSRASAATLCALLLANGRVLSDEHLADVRPWLQPKSDCPSGAVKVRISLLRNRLEDVGLGGSVIVTVRGQGYALAANRREEVLARLIEVAT